VIKGFRHRGIEKFLYKRIEGWHSTEHANRLRILLTTLNLATNPMDMNREGWGWHPLEGDLSGITA